MNCLCAALAQVYFMHVNYNRFKNKRKLASGFSDVHMRIEFFQNRLNVYSMHMIKKMIAIFFENF